MNLPEDLIKLTIIAQAEIGGMNGIRPLLVGNDYNVPTIDGDLMGRAYPRIYIMTPTSKMHRDSHHAASQSLTRGP